MDPVASEIGVVNGALALIRQPPLISLDQNTNAARTARGLIASVRDALLAEHRWNFAERPFVPAAQSTTADASGYYLHPLPDDCLTVVEIEGAEPRDWKVVAPDNPGEATAIQARILASKKLAPSVVGTWRVINVGIWSPLFRTVFEHRLAARLAPPLAGDNALAANMYEMAEAMLQKAKKRDGQEGTRSSFPRVTSWVAARRGGGQFG